MIRSFIVFRFWEECFCIIIIILLLLLLLIGVLYCTNRKSRRRFWSFGTRTKQLLARLHIRSMYNTGKVLSTPNYIERSKLCHVY